MQPLHRPDNPNPYGGMSLRSQLSLEGHKLADYLSAVFVFFDFTKTIEKIDDSKVLQKKNKTNFLVCKRGFSE